MRKLKVKFNELKPCSLFKDVPAATLKSITTYCSVKEFEADTTIIKQGDKGDSMMIILSGMVDVFKTEKNTTQKVASLGAGTFIGEGALVSGAPRNATIKTTSSVKMAFFDLDGFNKLVMSHHSIPVTLMKTHTERCKAIVKVNKNLFAKSKKVILVFGLLGAVLFFKYGGDMFGIEFLSKIGNSIPDEIMAMFGPITGAIFLKFQNMFFGDIANKIDSL